jgi:murein DD-endopeptidase MepM/ murein hydrolase activator NlpD
MRAFLGWFAFLGALMAGAAFPAFAAITDYPFRLVTKAQGSDQELVAENDGPAPITVHVTLTGENFASDRTWPATIIVPPNTALPLGRVFAADRAGGGYNFLFRYSHHFGRVDAVHDAQAAYRLPFLEGQSFAVTQAYGGRLTSHNNRENLYAIDFAMPAGTPIVAARGGIVIDATLRHQEGGFDVRFLDKANTVAIVHDDGTVAEYAHLSPGTDLVKPGNRVAAGDLLGHSGNTGYSSGPHLHFIVSKPTVTDGKVTRESVPVAFYAGDPTVRFAAQAGSTLTAAYGRVLPPGQAPTQQARQDAGTATGLTSQYPQIPQPQHAHSHSH